jgi:starch synthase
MPRLLFVAPEALFLPYRDSDHLYVGNESGRANHYLTYLISDLFHSGVDVHVVQPRYRRVFAENCPSPQGTCSHLPADRIHLAQDRFFYYIGPPCENDRVENVRLSIIFQREVINRWIPEIGPDLIHCHDWMSGLIPAVCRSFGITTLFCIGNLDTVKMPLSLIEEIGIDAAAFWQQLYYSRMPVSYEETRCSNYIDPLLSGIWSADCVYIVGGAAASELAASIAGGAVTLLRQMLRIKYQTARLACNPHPDSIHTQHQIELFEQILNRPLVRE